MRTNRPRQYDRTWAFPPAVCQFLIACLVLAVGTLVYLFDRDPSFTYFVPDALSQFNKQSAIFGWAGRHIPDWAHAYAFILLTCAAIQPRTRGVFAIAAFWLLTDIGFEIGQHREFSPWVVRQIPDWFSHFPVLENTRAFFREGYFDLYDVFAFALGAVCAYLTVLLMPPYRSPVSAVAEGVRKK